MTEERLRELCREWQKILRLQDWRVHVKLTRRWDMNEGAQGSCVWTLETRQATIKILADVDYEGYIGNDADAWPQDQEQTLVHELLHLHFAPFSAREGLEEIAQEQAIDAIAEALVELKRQGKQVMQDGPADQP